MGTFDWPLSGTHSNRLVSGADIARETCNRPSMSDTARPTGKGIGFFRLPPWTTCIVVIDRASDMLYSCTWGGRQSLEPRGRERAVYEHTHDTTKHMHTHDRERHACFFHARMNYTRDQRECSWDTRVCMYVDG